MALTKQDLKSIKEIVSSEIDSKLDIRLTALDSKLEGRFGAIEYELKEIRRDINGLREQIQQLAITLYNFVKMMTDYKEEFAILKAEVDQMKHIFKEKFGVEIAAQR